MTDYDKLIKQLNHLDTERINPNTTDIDSLTSLEIARKINNEDKKIAGVVEKALPQISQAADIFAQSIRQGGRIFYIGAGTSGRLGVLDAAECPPTFGSEPEQIVGVIAGGYPTLVLSKEGVEDDRDAAINDLKKNGVNNSDLVIGLAASVRTPYTLAGLEYATSVGARTAFVVCNDKIDVPEYLDVLITLPVGPEVITGSTRMKSGTAQKMALNMISTTAMVLLGKTYGNLMVDLEARSEKLAARSRKTLMDLLTLDLSASHELLELSGGSVKLAIVMHQFECSKEQAIQKLKEADGFVGRCV